MITINQAVAIATKAHEGQLRRGREPYVEHCKRVARKMLYKDAVIAALLHDVVEDTTLGLDDLEMMGVSKTSLAMIDILTKQDGENSLAYISRVIYSCNEGAIWIKAFDAADNAIFTPEDKLWTKENLGLDPDKEIEKYLHRKAICLDALGMADVQL